MIQFKIDDSLIYEILNFVYNSPDMTTTLREIIDHTSLSDYDAGNTAISELSNNGLLSAKCRDGVISVSFDSRGEGKLFIENFKHVSRLTSKEKWKERICGFVFGVLTTVISALILSCFGI